MKTLTNEQYRIIFDFYTKYGKLRTLARRHPEAFEMLLGDNTDNTTAREIMRLRYKEDSPLSFKEIAYKLGITERAVFKYHQEVMDKAIYCNTGSK